MPHWKPSSQLVIYEQATHPSHPSFHSQKKIFFLKPIFLCAPEYIIYKNSDREAQIEGYRSQKQACICCEPCIPHCWPLFHHWFMQRCTQVTLTPEKPIQLSLESARSLEGLGMGKSSEEVFFAKERKLTWQTGIQVRYEPCSILFPKLHISCCLPAFKGQTCKLKKVCECILVAKLFFLSALWSNNPWNIVDISWAHFSMPANI